jgi:hypothetical protein
MDEMKEFTDLAEANFITAKGMIIIALTVEIIVQTFALIVHPTDWWTWQLLHGYKSWCFNSWNRGSTKRRTIKQDLQTSVHTRFLFHSKNAYGL